MANHKISLWEFLRRHLPKLIINSFLQSNKSKILNGLKRNVAASVCLFDRAVPLMETPFQSFNSVSEVSSRASKSLGPKKSADHDYIPSLTADMIAEPVSLMSLLSFCSKLILFLLFW